MILVGVTGSIGSGKTTFSQYLAEQAGKSAHFESWQLVAEVANRLRQSTDQHPAANDIEAINAWLRALPPIVTEVCHKAVDFEQIRLTPAKLREAPDNYAKLLQYLEMITDQPDLQKGIIDDESKETFRSVLQWLGGYLVKTVGAGVWYDEIVRQIQDTPGIELATVGGVRFPGDARRIVNAGGSIICISRPEIGTMDANEITERERGLIVPDTTIVNDAGLPELLSCAAKVWKDLQSSQLVTEYVASRPQA
jgi:hypothetical protein